MIYAGMPEDDVQKVVLRPGEWSDFLNMDFKLLPLGMMNMSGICRFYLRSIEPHVELYASSSVALLSWVRCTCLATVKVSSLDVNRPTKIFCSGAAVNDRPETSELLIQGTI